MEELEDEEEEEKFKMKGGEKTSIIVWKKENY